MGNPAAAHLNKGQAVNAGSRNEAALPEGLKHWAATLQQSPGCCAAVPIST